ncbi:MAG: metallopeptidase TldD-related protein [Pseudomonadota bacterium]
MERDQFEATVAMLDKLRRRDERFTCLLNAESSDFVRLNDSAIVQAGTVEQAFLHIDWISGAKHASSDVILTGHADLDREIITASVGQLREWLSVVPDDPYFIYAEEIDSSERIELSDDRASFETAMAKLPNGAPPMVGIWASGMTVSGFANDLGQRNWHQTHSFNFDWSFHIDAERAVKANYAGQCWSDAAFEMRVNGAIVEREAMCGPMKEVGPGEYRVYLAPAALDEFLSIVSWGGFSGRAHQTKVSPLISMSEQRQSLSPLVSLRENTAEGVAPNFNASGHRRPAQVPLIRDGVYAQSLVSSRTAVEFGLAPNGAGLSEVPQSLDMDAGDLARNDILRSLDDGLYISRLWYLNFSDRTACRCTGMTRFATFRVKDGALRHGVHPMRFDDTLFNILGNGLEALTTDREELLDCGTYDQRSSRSARLPGALVSGMRFTL